MAWQEVAADDGSLYYYNDQTQETTWDKPAELFNTQEKAIAQLGWQKFTSDDGSEFWYNSTTDQSVWEIPPEVKEILDNNDGKQAAEQEPNQADEVMKEATPAAADHQAMDDSHPFATKSELVQNLSIKNNPRDAFLELLESQDLDGLSWSEAIPKLVSKPSYWVVVDPVERKSIFEEHLQATIQARAEKQRQKRDSERVALKEQLAKHPIKFYSRWRTFKPILENDPVFSQVEDEREKRLVFSQYVKELRRQHDDVKEQERRAELDKLADLMRHSEITADTRWEDARKVAQHSSLSSFDVFAVFEDYMKELERRASIQRQREHQAQYRVERKNREAFVKLLHDLRAKNQIKLDTKWKHLVSTIRQEDAYIQICGQPGSTPLELFWDVIEDEERKLKQQREVILDIMASARITIDDCHNFEKFKRTVTFDPKGRDIDEATLNIIYERLTHAAAKKREEDRYHQERQLRRAQDDLRYLIRDLEPAVRIDDTWERVRPRIERAPEFRAIKDDNAKRAAFDKHIRRLKEKQADREKERSRDQERRQRDAERIARNEQAVQPRGLDEGPYMDY